MTANIRRHPVINHHSNPCHELRFGLGGAKKVTAPVITDCLLRLCPLWGLLMISDSYDTGSLFIISVFRLCNHAMLGMLVVF